MTVKGEVSKVLPINNSKATVSTDDSPQVYKANALVEASYRLSLYEQRILLACISQVRRDQPITDAILYNITAAQVAEMSGVDVSNAYRDMKAAAERLFDRRVTLHQAPNGLGKANVRTTRWVQTVDYVEAEGRIALRFGKDILPYLTELTEQFTFYALNDVARMTSAHGIRTYELLMQWMGDREVPGPREREVSVEWLRNALQLEDSYPAMKDFKRWVIEPAVTQINDVSPVWVKWEQRKTGRKITHIKFIFEFKDADKAAAAQPKGRRGTNKGKSGEEMMFGLPKRLIEERAQPGEDYAQAAVRIKKQIERAKAREGQPA